jgi:hypothetical protein
MVRHAARCLEAVTAFRAAKVATDRPAGAASHSSGGGNSGAHSAENEDEQGARRYARLLISEIKLYHEAEVANGRREHDLTKRLGGEIARARVLYEQRVPAAVRQTADHFHEELVRTLANGDASLL